MAGPKTLTDLLNVLREVLLIDKVLISQSAAMNFQNHLHPWTTLAKDVS
jgi:hypothetical protein